MSETNPSLTPEMQAIVDAVGNAVRGAFGDLNTVTRRTPVVGDPGPDPTPRIDARTITDDRPVEKGVRMARAVRALALAKGDSRGAAYLAEHHLKDATVAKALSEGTNTAGGYLVPPEFSREIIELLRNQAVVRKAGARVLPMNSNVLNIPKQTGASTAAYVGENTNITPSANPAFGQVVLTAKKLATVLAISNELMQDSSPSVDAIIRDDLVMSMALKEDATFLRATASGTSPGGILSLMDPTNKFAANVTISTANTIKDLGQARYLVVRANTRMARPVWIFSPRIEGYLLTLADANSNLVFRPEMLTGKLMGYPYFVTGQVPDNLGAGTNESEVYFGDAMDLIIGENEQLAIDVSTEAAYFDGTNVVAAFSLDQTVIRVIQRHDFAMRYAQSFALINVVKWT